MIHYIYMNIYVFYCYMILANSHYNQSVWADLIRDILCGVSLNKSVKNRGFHTRQLLICGYRILLKTILFFFLASLNLMKRLFLIVAKAVWVQKRQARSAQRYCNGY